MHAQHLSQKLVRERQGVMTHKVMYDEDPTAAARLDRMNGIAGENVKGLAQQDLAVVGDQPPQLGAGVSHLVQVITAMREAVPLTCTT